MVVTFVGDESDKGGMYIPPRVGDAAGFCGDGDGFEGDGDMVAKFRRTLKQSDSELLVNNHPDNVAM